MALQFGPLDYVPPKTKNRRQILTSQWEVRNGSSVYVKDTAILITLINPTEADDLVAAHNSNLLMGVYTDEQLG